MPKNKTLFLLLAALALLPAVAAAQNKSLRELSSTSHNAAARLNTERPRVAPRSQAKGADSGKKEPDYLLFRNVVRKNSWLVGQGEPISQDVADKLPYYFRLSMKNDKGHYQFVEALRGQNLTTMHPLTPYILDKDNRLEGEPESVSEWRQKIGTVGQWMLTADLSGENMIEERAYEAVEKNANLIYVFQPVKIDANHAIASYLNDWGLPVDINESDDHYYGNVVQITYGATGLDSIVDFLDGRGLRRYNEFGVDQVRYAHDRNDRLTAHTNHNVVGRPMSDLYGHCGELIEYAGSGPDYTLTFVDTEMRPMVYHSNVFGLTFSKARMTHDRFGRLESVEVVDGPGIADGDERPVRRISVSYDPKGNPTVTKEYAE